jgi:hypothetical protein
MAGRAAGTRARLDNAVRHGGPTTFTPKPARPYQGRSCHLRLCLQLRLVVLVGMELFV